MVFERTERTTKKGTPEAFLEELRKQGNVSGACTVSLYPRQRAYELRNRDPDFAAAWDDALDEAVDTLEKEAWRRACKGNAEPVYQNGEKIGEVRKYSDTLLIFLLKGHRPKRFRERADVNLNVGDIDSAIERELIRGRDLAGLAGGTQAGVPAETGTEEQSGGTGEDAEDQ